MFNQSKRCFVEGIMNISVKDGRTVYSIESTNKKENGKYDIVIYKNDKVFSIQKNAGTSVKGINRKIQKTAAFYNNVNDVKRLASLEQKNKEVEKRHKVNLRKRDTMIKKDIAAKKRVLSKVQNVEKPVMSEDLKNILMSMDAVK